MKEKHKQRPLSKAQSIRRKPKYRREDSIADAWKKQEKSGQ